jgi:hypothetical protein
MFPEEFSAFMEDLKANVPETASVRLGVMCSNALSMAGACAMAAIRSGADEIKTVSVPHNYRLEVEQLGRCIAGDEVPHVSEDFSLANARTVDRILDAIGYGK